MRNLLKVCKSLSLSRSLSTIPKLRFVQYTKCSDQKKYLGVTCEDGSQIIEISKYKCYPNDLKEFIEKKIDLREIQSKVDCYEPIKTDDVKLLPPLTNPQKIICIGLNYKSHCDEQKIEYPTEPVFFSKFPTALIGPTDDIIAHKITTKLDWEVELGVVIGSKAHKVSREKAMDHVFGYTVANDITAREWQKRNGGQWLISKTMDKTCPIGPCVVSKTELDVSNLAIRCSVNNVMKQCGKTSEFIFPIDDIISRLSQCITLMPGDLILTGTCAGVGVFREPREFLKPGDVVECEIEGIGKLINTVVEDTSC